MPIEVATWIIGGVLGVVSLLVGTLWKITRDEKSSQDAAIKLKADEKRVDQMETRINNDITYSREHHQMLLDKSEARVDREMASMENRLKDSISRSESNILTHMNMMLDILKEDRRRNG